MSIDAKLLKATPQPIRYQALVGQFLEYFAALEATINLAIETAFGLTMKQGAVLMPEIPFAKKVFMLRTIARETFEEEDDEKFQSLMKQYTRLSETRNVVAHSIFEAQEGGDGVQFLVIKARGRLEFPQMTWTVDDAVQQIKDMLVIDKKLSRFIPKLKQFTAWRDATIAIAAMSAVESSAPSGD